MATDVLHFFTSCLGAQFRIKPPAIVVIPMSSFPQAEQLLLIVMHEFPKFILHVTCSFLFVVFMNNLAYNLCIFCFPLLFTRLQLLLFLSQLFLHCSGNLTHPCSCLLTFLDCVLRVNTSVSMRAFRCVPVHLLRNRTPTCLALVTVRTLALTNPGPPPRMRPIQTCTDPQLSFSFVAWP